MVAAWMAARGVARLQVQLQQHTIVEKKIKKTKMGGKSNWVWVWMVARGGARSQLHLQLNGIE